MTRVEPVPEVERLGKVTARQVAVAQGNSVAVHDFGGDGPTLLFAHATGMHGWVWRPVADRLVDGAHCVAIDLRGHGDSALPAGFDLSWAGFGSDVLAVARDLDVRNLIGVGHSLGGAALLIAELEAPGTFAHLFLYEPAVHVDSRADSKDMVSALRDAMVEMTRRRRADFPSLDDALANYAGKAPMAQFHAEVLGAYVSHGFSDHDDDGGHHVTLKCSPDTEARIYAGTSDHDTASRLRAITCRVTLATGSESDTLQRRTIEALADELHCSTVVFEGADHFGPLQQPQQFADAVSRHLLTG